MRLDDLDTPALLLDLPRLECNARRMLDRCRRLGVRLRPHLKTLKSIDAARLAIDPTHGGIAAATLNEAEYFASHGIADIQYAVCIAPHRLPRVARILAQARRFSMFVDSAEVAGAVTDYARRHAVPFRVWIEVDSGAHRTGTDPAGAELLRIAGALGSPVILEGVATHAGHAYAASGAVEIARIADDERRAAVTAAERLRAAGFAAPGVSIGSTPTATYLPSAVGLTEVRAGVYLAGDLFQATLGALAIDDAAVSVLATVISRRPELRQVVIDAGGLALSKDRSTARFHAGDCGYGLVMDSAGQPSYGRLCVSEVHQEHGEIHDVAPEILDRLAVGTRVRVLPNHACMTAAMYTHYALTGGGTVVTGRWPRTNGWD